MSIIIANQLSKHYGAVQALHEVGFRVEPEERVALIGRSGSGKSTLLNLLAGLDSPTSGELVVAGKALGRLSPKELAAYRCREIGVVFQSFQLLPNLTTLANVEMPLILQGVGKSARRERALEALDRVGLADRSRHRPTQLSGGEQQRVAIARAMVHRPGLVLADEPTGNLDSSTADEVMSLILEVVAEKRAAMVFITHDAALARDVSTRIVTTFDVDPE